VVLICRPSWLVKAEARDVEHVELHRDAARETRGADDECAGAVLDREDIRRAATEAERGVADRDAHHAAAVGGGRLLEGEVAAQRLAEDDELHVQAFDLHELAGGQDERDARIQRVPVS
jgi:hypothetical protein